MTLHQLGNYGGFVSGDRRECFSFNKATHQAHDTHFPSFSLTSCNDLGKVLIVYVLLL
jgi:hypothetical protein